MNVELEICHRFFLSRNLSYHNDNNATLYGSMYACKTQSKNYRLIKLDDILHSIFHRCIHSEQLQ